MHVVLVGTSHHVAPVELRERMSVDEESRAELLERVRSRADEAVALSTCNRVCLYLAAGDAQAATSLGLAELARLGGLSAEALAGAVYVKQDEDAARHLFRVAAGLDSLVPGESQILGQVRHAFEAAERVGSTGPVLHRLFRQALHAGRRVRNETRIGENPASVSSAAVELAGRIFDDLEWRTVLLVGAGKMGQLAAAGLAARGVRSIVVANRSSERAGALASRHEARAIGLDQLEAELARADIVISSTGAGGYVLDTATVKRALGARRGRPLFLVDIAVPRDLEPAINDLDGCYLYDVDDLERVVEATIAGSREETARAEAIVEAEARSFGAWQRSLEVVPAIASLRRRAEEIREAELHRARAKLASLGPKELSAVESLTAQILNKLLHAPTVRLKEAAAGADGSAYAETVRHLFDLRDDDRRTP